MEPTQRAIAAECLRNAAQALQPNKPELMAPSLEEVCELIETAWHLIGGRETVIPEQAVMFATYNGVLRYEGARRAGARPKIPTRRVPLDLHAIKHDAIRQQFRPAEVVVTSKGQLVYLTSWPFQDASGNFMVMARTEAGDASTNIAMEYFDLMRRVGTFNLD